MTKLNVLYIYFGMVHHFRLTVCSSCDVVNMLANKYDNNVFNNSYVDRVMLLLHVRYLN